MPGEFDKAVAALKELGFDDDMVAQVVSGAETVRSKAQASGLRHKSKDVDFGLDQAREMIMALETRIKELGEKLVAVDLAKHAAEAVAKERSEVTPEQEVYTLDDIEEVVSKAVTAAMEPFVEQSQKNASQSLSMWEKLHQLDTVTKSAAEQVGVLAGELPRAIRARAPIGRYDDGRESETVVPAATPAGQSVRLKTEDDGDVFGWVDEFVNQS